MKKGVFILFLFIQIIGSFAQNGPGGFGATNGSSNLVLWLDANQLSQADGSNITSWIDASGKGNNASATINTPTFQTNTINGYPTTRYTTSDFLTVNDNSSLNPNKISYFIVANYTDTSDNPDDDFAQFIYKSDLFLEQNGYGVYRNGSSSNFVSIIGSNGTSNFSIEPIIDGANTIFYTRYKSNGNKNLQTRTNESGAKNTDTSNTNITSNNDDLLIGGLLNGEIAEVIIIDTDIKSSERKIIANYLAAKYNISIPTSRDYYTMDSDANGNFDHKVAGIGREGGSNFINNSRGTGIVTISSPSSLGNGDYLFWGENVKDANYTFSTTSDYKEQIDTKWRVSEVGNVGTVTVSFDISGINLTEKQACADLKLVVSNDDFVSDRTEHILTIAGSTATVTNVNFADADYFTLEYIDEIVLDGTTFYNGSGSGNAPDTTDECYKFTVKSTATATGIGVINQNIKVREIEVETGGKLAVTTGNYIEVVNDIVLNGDIRLVGSSQLIRNTGATNLVSGNGKLYIDQQSKIGTNSEYRYTYWSSPVTEIANTATYKVGDVMKDGTTPTSNTGNAAEAQNITFIPYDGNALSYNGAATTPITIANHWIYTYLNGTNNNDFIHQYETEPIPVAQGYLMKGSGRAGGQGFTFKGAPNDGDYNIILNPGTNSLLGNPYPSAIDAVQFITDNSSVIYFGAIYFWQHIGEASTSTIIEGHTQSGYLGGYAVRNLTMGVSGVSNPGVNTTTGGNAALYNIPGQYVPVGQGFLVTSVTGGTINFKNSQRAYQAETEVGNPASPNDSFFFGRSAANANEKPLLRIGFEHTNPNNVLLHRQIAVGFKEGNSFLNEYGYDSPILDTRATDVAWKFPSDENYYVIAGIQAFNNDIEIPIAVGIAENKPVKFMVDQKMNIDDTIYLKDAVSGEYYDLTNPIELTLDSGFYPDRFFITFKKGAVLNTDNQIIENTSVYFDKNLKELVITTQNKISLEKINLFDLLGKEIKTWQKFKNSNTETRLKIDNLSNGIYIVNIKTTQGIVSKKVLF